MYTYTYPPSPQQNCALPSVGPAGSHPRCHQRGRGSAPWRGFVQGKTRGKTRGFLEISMVLENDLTRICSMFFFHDFGVLFCL